MSRLPVLLVTGFLGSGKTTLINRLLREGNLAPTAVIVNEAGAVAIDHLLVERGSEDTVLIDGGCVCCAQRSGLAAAVIGLLRRRQEGSVPAFERILIETSGLADPVPIVQTFIGDRTLARHCEMEGVVTVVDLATGASALRDNPEAVSQVAMADVLLFSKVEIAEPEQAAAADAMAACCNRHAPRRLVGNGPIELPLLLADEAGVAWKVAQPITAGVHLGVSVSSLSFPGMLSEAVLEAWLDVTIGTFGLHLLRLKAVLNMAGQERPVVLHGVQHIIHAPSLLTGWADGTPCNRVLLIARDLEQKHLDDALQELAYTAEMS